MSPEEVAADPAFGSMAKLATALGITRQSVWEWGDVIPVVRAYQIERLTGGRLLAERMNPDCIPHAQVSDGESR